MARVLPRGLNASEETGPPGPLMSGVAIRWWVARSHNHTVPPVPSLLPAARVLPSRLNASELMLVWLISAAPIGRWLATSHNRTLPSLPPAARVLPSRLNATELMLVWLISAAPIGRWLATSHNRTLPSLPPAARVLPSGLNATE